MNIKENTPLNKLNTFKIGGNAKYFVEINNENDLRWAIDFALENKLPIFTLGGGSNVLISDEGFKGLVLKINLKGVLWNDLGGEVEVVSCAGENWDDLVKMTVQKNLSGLENLSAIPGSVGAAPVQNIGAYGSEIKSNLSWVEVFDIEKKEFKKLTNKECQFGYRGSIFKKPEGKNFIITKVSFILKKEGRLNLSYKDISEYFSERNIENPTLGEVREAVIQIRGKKFPDLNKYGTAGSFFKNPIISKEKLLEIKEKYPDLPSFPVDLGQFKIPAAWILDKICGLKGYRVGDVGAFEKQAIVLVNYGNATARDLEKISAQMIKTVKEKIGIDIEREVTLVGSF